MSPWIWISGVATLIAIGLGIVLWRRKRQGHWQYIEVRSKGGQLLDSKWKFEPEPERIEPDWTVHLEPYCERLVNSKNWFTTLDVFSIDGQNSCSLNKQNGELTFVLILDKSEVERDAKVRKFFWDRGTLPTQDYSADNGECNDAIRILAYPIAGDARAISQLLKVVATELCNVPESAPIDLRFEEHPEETQYPDEGEITIEISRPSWPGR